MMFVVPEANTPEERAAAGGMPFNAKEVVDRVEAPVRREAATSGSASGGGSSVNGGGPGRSAAAVPAPPWLVAVMPLFGLVHLILFLIAAGMMISLVNTGAILSWQKPPDVPLWAAALMLFIAYQIARLAIPGVQHWVWRSGAGAGAGWFAFWHAVIWLIGLAIVLWVASDHIPEITRVHAAHAAPVQGSDVRGA